MLWPKPKRSLNKIPYFHCTTHWYCFISITVSVFGKSLQYPSQHIDKDAKKGGPVRSIAGVTPRTNTDPLYSALNTMPSKSLYMYAIGLFMYIFSNEMLPDLFPKMFTQVDEAHTYNTRNFTNNHLYTSFHPTRRGKKMRIHALKYRISYYQE